MRNLKLHASFDFKRCAAVQYFLLVHTMVLSRFYIIFCISFCQKNTSEQANKTQFSEDTERRKCAQGSGGQDEVSVVIGLLCPGLRQGPGLRLVWITYKNQPR